jgi:hypothetical protein
MYISVEVVAKCPVSTYIFNAIHHFKAQVYGSLGRFGGLDVGCWPLVPKFTGSHLAEAVGF